MGYNRGAFLPRHLLRLRCYVGKILWPHWCFVRMESPAEQPRYAMSEERTKLASSPCSAFWVSGWNRLYKKLRPLDLQPDAPNQDRDWKVLDRHLAACERVYQEYQQNAQAEPLS